MNVPEKLEVPVVVKDTYGNEHEVERLVYKLERNGKSRWAELFGTPERAAQMAYIMSETCGIACSGCPMNGVCTSYDALLKWLKDDAE